MQRPHLRSRPVSTRQEGHGGNSGKTLRRNTGNRPYNASHPKKRRAEKAYARSVPPGKKRRIPRKKPQKKDAGCLTALASQPKPNYLLPCIGAAGCAVFGLLLVLIRSLGIRFSGAAALIFDDVAVLPQGTVTGWLVVAYLALLCTCLSYVLQNTALTRLSSYTVSLLQCTQPILTAACSYLLLGGRSCRR